MEKLLYLAIQCAMRLISLPTFFFVPSLQVDAGRRNKKSETKMNGDQTVTFASELSLSISINVCVKLDGALIKANCAINYAIKVPYTYTPYQHQHFSLLQLFPFDCKKKKKLRQETEKCFVAYL